MLKRPMFVFCFAPFGVITIRWGKCCECVLTLLESVVVQRRSSFLCSSWEGEVRQRGGIKPSESGRETAAIKIPEGR